MVQPENAVGIPAGRSGWKYPSLSRDLVASVSLANLCFIRIWQEALAYRVGEAFLMSRVPSRDDCLAAMAGALILAAVFFGLLALARRLLHGPWFSAAQFSSLVLAAIPLNALRAILSPYVWFFKSPGIGLANVWTIGCAIILATMLFPWLLWRFRQFVFKAVTATLLMLSPFALYTFGRAAWAAAQTPPSERVHPLADRLANPRLDPRAVWIIFDEWDYRLTFVDRPASLSMPAIDRLRSESVSATDARSPAMNTADSLPSLLTGRRQHLLADVGESRFSLEASDGIYRSRWQDSPTVFSTAREAGFNTALVGWYLPYCRILNLSLTECSWWSIPLQANSTGDTLAEKIPGQLRSLFETDSLSLFGQSETVAHAARNDVELLRRAGSVIADKDMGLIFVHVPVPHAPHPFNRFAQQFNGANQPVRGYLDSLALLDRMFATWRDDLERAGLWEKTAVVISADHPFRQAAILDGKSDLRVPFLVKLAGQKTPASFDGRFETIGTSELILSILRGRVNTTQDILGWMRQRTQPNPTGQASATTQ